jgi:hypothetical protein
MISTKHFGFVLVALSLFLIFGISQALAANTPEKAKAEIEKAGKAAEAATKPGPAERV